MNAIKKILKQSKKSANKGFTLIELLVVIGILGILAAALLATIDPFEQLKKSQDATTKNMSVEYLNALVRYYTTHNQLPWQAGDPSCTTAPAPLTLDKMTGCTNLLVTEGELKASFTTSNNLKYISVFNPNPNTGNATDSEVCFVPTSKSQQKDPGTIYDPSSYKGTCTPGGAAKCIWCAQ